MGKKDIGIALAVLVALIALGSLVLAIHPGAGKGNSVPLFVNTAAAGGEGATTSAATPVTVTVKPLAPAAVNPLPIDSRDALVSWTIPGAASSSADAVTAKAEIARLMSVQGTGRYPDEAVYLDIAGHYELLGDGKDAYDFYVKAAEAAPARGVALYDLGNLMERLHALHTAETAYAKAVSREPGELTFRTAYLDFLAHEEPDAASTAEAFAAARLVFAGQPNFLISEANWLSAIGSTTAAIADWELVRAAAGPDQQKSIDAVIAKLSAHA
ncbi:MAG: hypothetical protein KGI41_03900 [Patescibacteria group bacterium]|nr:hypothetical protein [Patescibacteria group bacterium]